MDSNILLVVINDFLRYFLVNAMFEVMIEEWAPPSLSNRKTMEVASLLLLIEGFNFRLGRQDVCVCGLVL